MKTHQTLFVLLLIFALTGCTQPTAAPTPLPTTAVPPSPMPSATHTPALPPPTATLTPSPAATETPTLMPSLTSTNIPPVPAGWLAFIDFSSGSSGFPQLNIAQTREQNVRAIIEIEDMLVMKNPAWSPDGQWIAVLARSGDFWCDESYINLARPDGSAWTRLATLYSLIEDISWSPDGKYLIYSQLLRSDGLAQDIYTIEISTGNIQQLTYTPGQWEDDPVYSPDGSTIAYISIEKGDYGSPPSSSVMLMDANGENARPLTYPSNGVTVKGASPSWSPDGQRIAFVSPWRYDGSIAVINIDGSSYQKLTGNLKEADDLSWSSDGEWIVFTYGTLVYERIYALRADGSALQDIWILPREDIGQPTWSPLPALQVGGTYAITELGGRLNLRLSPALDGEVVEKLHEGDEILVLEGPVEASQYLWWRVRLGDGDLEGWVAENPGWFAGK